MKSARFDASVRISDPTRTSVNSALTPQSAAMACATSNMIPFRLFVFASRKPCGGLDDVMTTFAAPCFFTSARDAASAWTARRSSMRSAASDRIIDSLLPPRPAADEIEAFEHHGGGEERRHAAHVVRRAHRVDVACDHVESGQALEKLHTLAGAGAA